MLKFEPVVWDKLKIGDRLVWYANDLFDGSHWDGINFAPKGYEVIHIEDKDYGYFTIESKQGIFRAHISILPNMKLIKGIKRNLPSWW